ncbi:uncharacterized protein N7506_008890 [Penicillium brevicompactum]|uniref:uncharacterized protein n=1 Tax=Penicillium brevicompactum TaxID=5074 RepID=UPI0025409189|nr:uncharacterized protein N7506_008890 [Penicillium brevicompactum]KAJ5325788.1 hypothetical protein N7506_008890 [Penicillium brevicompactum]
MPSSARKKGKKAAKPEPPCSAAEFSAVKESFTNYILDYLAEKNHSLAGPRPDSDALGSATSAVASVEDEENPSATSAKATVNDPTSDDEGEFGENQDAYMNLYPSTSEDKTLYLNNNLLSVLPLSPSTY